MKEKRRTNITLLKMKISLETAKKIVWKKRRVLTIGKDWERIHNKIIFAKIATTRIFLCNNRNLYSGFQRLNQGYISI